MDITQTAKSLYRFAKKSPENQEQLEAWYDQAVLDLADASGQTVQSTSGNGIQVSFMSSGMSTADWFNCLSMAMGYLETPPVTRTIATLL